MPIKLDVKKFKHISSDDKTTILQHKDGHEIRIAHNVLSKESKAQLEQLAKSTQTKDQAKESQKEDRKSGTVYTKTAAKGVEQAQEIKRQGGAEHGATIVVDKPKMAEGGDVETEQPPMLPQMSTEVQALQQPSQVDPKTKELQDRYNAIQSLKPDYTDTSNLTKHNASETMFGPNGEAPLQLDQHAAELALHSQQQAELLKQAQIGAQVQKQAKDQQLLSQFGAKGVPPLPPVQETAQGQTVVPEQGAVSEEMNRQPQGLATPQSNPMDSLMNDPEAMMKAGYKSQLQGINAEAQAIGDLGKAQAQILANDQIARQQAQDKYKEDFAALDQERKALIQDVKEGHISPEKFWTGDPKTGEGGHSKVMTGIGMILAGFNPTNNPNAAVNFLKFQMEQNLAAQAKNLDAKNTLLGHNLRQFGNLKDAADFTRIQQNDMLTHQLEAAAATAKTPMAQAAAKQAAGKLQMESAGIFQNFAMRRAMMNLADNGNPAATEQMIAYMRAVNPEMAKSMEARYVPGVGLGSIPVPEKVREEIVAHSKLQSAAQDLEQFSKTHSTIIPGTPEYNVGVQKAMILQQQIREGMLGTVFRESEKPLLDKMINENPAGFFKAFSTQPKLKELMRSNEQQSNILKQSYGLPVKHQSIATSNPMAQKEQAIQWAKQNPGPKADKILKALGVK